VLFRSMDIDKIPWPDYEGFGIDEYHKRHNIRYMGVLASRGCPYSCTFCASVCKYRERSLDCVSEEIDSYIQRYRIEYLVVYDNTLNVTKDRFMSFCEMMKPKHLAWGAAIRADVFDDEMAKAFKDSGGQYFVVGIESFNQARLDKMNKMLRADQIWSTLNFLHKHDIGYHGNVIMGINGESMDDIVSEVESIPHGYNVFPVLAQSFPGTRISSSLTPDQRDHINRLFTQYAQNSGKSVYPVS
jgi:anaerobic magnesium-protoporphyrin IX monomethyl ester cyclase